MDIGASTTRGCATPDAYPGEVKVLYAGRLTNEKGADLLADTLPAGARA